MRYHNPSHTRPGSAHRGPSSFAQARCHTRREKPSPAALHPFQFRPPPRAVDNGFAPGQTTPPVPGRGASGPRRSHPGAELSFPAPYPCPTVTPET